MVVGILDVAGIVVVVGYNSLNIDSEPSRQRTTLGVGSAKEPTRTMGSYTFLLEKDIGVAVPPRLSLRFRGIYAYLGTLIPTPLLSRNFIRRKRRAASKSGNLSHHCRAMVSSRDLAKLIISLSWFEQFQNQIKTKTGPE